ncbi:MAG: hypoxanthine phosphoribosyltransferase [Pseudomonadota bacterium]
MTAIKEGDIEVLISAAEIQARIKSLADEISDADFKNLLVIAILKGSFIFAADLLRAMQSVGLGPEVDFVTLSSYRKGTQSTGSVQILRDIDLDVSGRDVLLIDDILESGRTLAFAKDLISARGASQIKTCVLLNKTVRRSAEIEADFKAFECPDYFVVGYGMDLAYRYRELPFVGRVVRSES